MAAAPKPSDRVAAGAATPIAAAWRVASEVETGAARPRPVAEDPAARAAAVAGGDVARPAPLDGRVGEAPDGTVPTAERMQDAATTVAPAADAQRT